jgi:hypothetical protein
MQHSKDTVIIYLYTCDYLFWQLNHLKRYVSKDRFPLGGRIFRAERNFFLSCDFSGELIRKDKEEFRSARKIPPSSWKTGLIKACFPLTNLFARSEFSIV